MPPRKTPRAKAPGSAELQTFAEAMGVTSDEDEEEPGAEERVTRSFYLRKSTISKLQATMAGITHRTYGTELMGRAPQSLAALVDEAALGAVTYYQDLLNDGNPFPDVTGLTPGPSRAGAKRGAATRARARAAAAERDDDGATTSPRTR